MGRHPQEPVSLYESSSESSVSSIQQISSDVKETVLCLSGVEASWGWGTGRLGGGGQKGTGGDKGDGDRRKQKGTGGAGAHRQGWA